MPEGKRRYKATINGESYTIVGPKSQEHMKTVAETVDEQLVQLKQLTKGLSSEKQAILLAINTVSDQLTMQKELAELKEKMEQLQNE
ncbi:cell division protein ZapA [Alkalibacterium olivapovliticus]|uniref:Cell division protein ZapA n=1 Tax=Alkalibacterium olivapovliticus TaxID=99907 RepID=A0A2T0VUH1_9LACT|nr:cell division protein ZapA [Alkalibacterium olivapovliticus]PRY75180.1 cell division protein ZapA [Alkalibacterium olivapovliticus]